MFIRFYKHNKDLNLSFYLKVLTPYKFLLLLNFLLDNIDFRKNLICNNAKRQNCIIC